MDDFIEREQGNLPLNAVIERLNELRLLTSAGKEYWHARDIQTVLGYTKWDTFQDVILRAMTTCRAAGNDASRHFLETRKVSDTNKGPRGVDYWLSRFACYMIALEGDGSKQEIATAKTYFAVKARMQEIQDIEQRSELSDDEKRLFLRQEVANHNKKLAGAAKAAGVITPLDYAIFTDEGYLGQYGMRNAKRKEKMGLKPSQNILDHMGSTELAANLFRTTQTEEKLRTDNIKGKVNANRTHYDVGVKVRKAIADIGGTMPENLPPAPPIREIEKRLKKAGRELPPKR